MIPKILLAMFIWMGGDVELEPVEVVEYTVDAPIEDSVFQSGTAEDGTKVYFTEEFILGQSEINEGDTVCAIFLPSEDEEGIFIGVFKWAP